MEKPSLTYEIPCWRMDSIRKRLDAIVRRAGKRGLTEFTYSVAPERIVKQFSRLVPGDPFGDASTVHEHYEKYDVECNVVTINCPKPSLNGWSFVGRIEHMVAEETGEPINLIYSSPDEEVPALFHERPQICEHCNTLRLRRDTFIVRKDAEYKQVGSTCLSDFLGVDASSMLAYAEIMSGLDGACGSDDMTEEDWGSMRQSRCYTLREVLLPAAAITLNSGYISRKAADEGYGKIPTSEHVRNYITSRNDTERRKIIPDEWWTIRVEKLVEDTIQWLRDLASHELADLDDYSRNLAAVVKINRCPWKAIGILGSAAYSLMRQVERNQKNADAQKSQHQGSIKERITRTVTVVMEKPYESMFGTGVIYKFVDADGNRYLWFATTNKNWSVGQNLTIKGTVKAHEQDKYEGNCNVTMLNRVAEV